MKILLAEADGAPAGRLFHLLVKNGYQTTAVKTGQAAHDEIGRSYFDMVIAEACPPAVDGCALVRSLRAAGSPTPVLLLTERAHGEAMHQASCRPRTTVSSSRSMTTSYCCASRRCSGARRPAASAAAT